MAANPGTATARFTLIELMVVLGIIMLLSGMLLPVLSQGKERAREAECMSSLKNLSTAFEVYKTDYEHSPRDLRGDLVERAQTVSSQFLVCPSTKNSYDKFYVMRGSKLAGNEFVIGCPYHRSNTRAVSAFADCSVQIGPIGKVMWNDVEIRVGDEVNGGLISLQNGSSATLLGGSGALVVASIIGDGGTTYTVVRSYITHGNVQVQADVSSGARFDVVTPGGIAAGKNGEFKVTTSTAGTTYATQTEVISGTVILTSAGGAGQDLGAGDTGNVEVADEACQLDP